MSRKVLIVDDNVRVTKLIKSYMEKEGYRTFIAYSGLKAIDSFRKNKPDLIILDLMIPEISGLEVAEIIRKESTVPIIMVTARSEEDDKLKGLDLGADDYIVKPFSPRELAARVKVLFRRIEMESGIKNQTSSTVEYKGISMNEKTREVFYKNQEIELTTLQFDLLYIMVNSPKEVFTRSMLLEQIEAEEEIFERTIDAHIKNIRKAIGESGRKDGIIHTVHGLGYKCE